MDARSPHSQRIHAIRTSRLLVIDQLEEDFVTLVLACVHKESIWLLADRRLTFVTGQIQDDACKITHIETKDGVAILGYAGLGLTAAGVQPSDWMARVVRGQSLTLEQSLNLVAEAAKRELPRHLLALNPRKRSSHVIVAPAIVADEPRLYFITAVLSANGKDLEFGYHRYVGKHDPFVMAGTGGRRLNSRRNEWEGSIRRLLLAYDKGRIPAHTVAQQLAKLNNKVHTDVASVGPRCMVTWRNHRLGGPKMSANETLFFTGSNRDDDGVVVPTVASSIDMGELARDYFAELKGLDFKTVQDRMKEIGDKVINAALTRKPDGKLQ